jgi:hypothetical protein
MPTISIDAGAKELLDAIAAREGITRKQLVHALVNYAASIYIRPGSWEASTAFDLGNYVQRSPDRPAFADQWFSGDRSSADRI